MIIRCQDGSLLESRHVVQWQVMPAPLKAVHTVMANTVLGTSIEVFRGTEAECEIQRDEIEQTLCESDLVLGRLCKSYAQQDNKLEAGIKRLIAVMHSGR